MSSELLLSLDPSSTASGYCVMTNDERIVDAGVLRVKRRAVAQVRIEVMAADLMTLLDKARPGLIIIETTSGYVNSHRHKGGGRGLAILGLAIGRLWGQAELWRHTLPLEGRSDVEVCLVEENRWIAGRTKKNRQQEVQALYPSYDPEADRGFDCSDAICLALWFLSERRLQALQTLRTGGAK